MPYGYASSSVGVPDPTGLPDGTLAAVSDEEWAAAAYACIDAGADRLALRLMGEAYHEALDPILRLVSTSAASEGISPEALLGFYTVQDGQEMLRAYIAGDRNGTLMLAANQGGDIFFEMMGIGGVARLKPSAGMVIGSPGWMNDADPGAGGLALEGVLQPIGGIHAGDLPTEDPQDGVSVWVDEANGNVLKRASSPE
ncbi:MAG: hypothetical protein FJ288_16365 [Planctomycetes bacterium]|nr:hypothetical protein [Planctomycetota bacterium]